MTYYWATWGDDVTYMCIDCGSSDDPRRSMDSAIRAYICNTCWGVLWSYFRGRYPDVDSSEIIQHIDDHLQNKSARDFLTLQQKLTS